jgi:hypothetical protein
MQSGLHAEFVMETAYCTQQTGGLTWGITLRANTNLDGHPVPWRELPWEPARSSGHAYNAGNQRHRQIYTSVKSVAPAAQRTKMRSTVVQKKGNVMTAASNDSSDPAIPAITGTQSGKDGTAILGTADGIGVLGQSTGSGGLSGVRGESSAGPGISGSSTSNFGVHGVSVTNHGVHGDSTSGRGVQGISQTFFGVSGVSTTGVGVRGESDSGIGVEGSSPHNLGVHGVSDTNHGVHGDSNSGRGVQGISQTFFGVSGVSTTGVGVGGESESGIGVFGKGGQLAARFEGNVEVTGDISFSHADCAEDFDVEDAASAEPGTVMVLGERGELRASHQAYDRRVAGVVSGAGDYKPGIILDKQMASANRQPIALLGKVYCKIDAQFGEVEVGDLLTSSSTPGYAMKISDPLRAFGAVIGKALLPLKEGRALIPILVSLQ